MEKTKKESTGNINAMALLFSVVFVFTFLFNSCMRMPDTDLVDEQYTPTDEELFLTCADLKGVGKFIIGSSTFKQIVNDPELKKRHYLKSNLISGYWGFGYNKHKHSDWIDKIAGKTVKQLHFSSNVHIGDLEFSEFDMAFLNDTLVAIKFWPFYSCENAVINHYKEKYGNGRGRYYSKEKRLYNLGGKCRYYECEKYDERVWENETVALKYKFSDKGKVVGDKVQYSEQNSSLLIYSKTRYEAFEQERDKIKQKLQEKISLEKEETFNSL